MFFSVILIFLFIITILVLGYKKHFTWSFCLYFLGIALLIFSSILYTLKFSTSIFENRTDRFMYYTVVSRFSYANMNITTVSSIVNLGLVLIMLGSSCLTKIINPSGKILFVLANVCTVLFGAVNHHTVCFKEFLFINSTENARIAALFQKAANCVNTLSFAFFIFMLILPHLYLIKIFIRSKIYIRRKDSASTEICLILIDLFIVCYFIIGHFSVFMPWNVTLLKFPVQSVMIQSRAFITQILLLLSLTVLYIIIKYNPFASVKFQTKNAMLKEYLELNHSLRMIFHVNKNILHTVELLAEQAIDFHEKKQEISLGNLKEIRNMVKDSQITLSRMLTMLDDISIKNTKTNIIDAMEKALSQISLPPYISVVKNYDTEASFFIQAAPVHITESFTNILLNSIEAIETKNTENGLISISIYSENEYVAVEITDNGCGIKKSDRRYIFNMLASTKKSSTNWGIGLAYVKKVVNVYNGNLFVKSEFGSYTTIQIDFRQNKTACRRQKHKFRNHKEANL